MVIFKADKQILDIIRPWTTLFCPIKGIDIAQEKRLFANVYVDVTDSFGNFTGTLNCTTPSNDANFYNYTLQMM